LTVSRITIITTNLRSSTFYTYVHIQKDTKPYTFSAVFREDKRVTGLLSSTGCRIAIFPALGYFTALITGEVSYEA